MSLRYFGFALFRTVSQVPFGYMKLDLKERQGKVSLKVSQAAIFSSPASIPNQALYIRMVLDLQCETRRNRST